MHDATARAVAYIAGRLATASTATSVLDRRAEHRTAFTGEVRPDRVFVHDRDLDCLITGEPGDGNTMWLLHQGTMRLLRLEEDSPGHWLGFDYASHHSFDLGVDEGGQVRLLDFQDGVWRTYQL